MQEFCICCGKTSKYSIHLAVGSHAKRLVAIPRYYLPNQHARNPKFPPVVDEIHFCRKCMRSVEDAVRSTILYLQAENDQLSIKPGGLN
jgi:hypothetical protein